MASQSGSENIKKSLTLNQMIKEVLECDDDNNLSDITDSESEIGDFVDENGI